MQSFGRRFTILTSVDSTNNYAMREVHAGLANHGDVFLAYDQTLGKGQRNKQWLTQPGENITMSILTLPVSIPTAHPFLLVAAVALGVYDFFRQYAGKNTRIKWPNDIFWGDRKAGGILIENQIRNQKWRVAVIGIGLNINQTDFGAISEKVISLTKITGKKYNILELAKELCNLLEERYRQLLSGNGNDILNEYISVMYKLNEEVNFKIGETDFRAIIEGVTPAGILKTNHPEFGQLSWGRAEWIV